MTRPESAASLMAFIKAVPRGMPVCLWSGVPCTGGSPLQNMNKWRPGHAQSMRKHLDLWTRLFDGYLALAQVVVQRGGHLAIEWPVQCRYWHEPVVESLLGLKDLGLRSMKVRACAHGQLFTDGPHEGKALTKQWRVVSTIPKLEDVLAIPCPGTHEHVTTGRSHS